MTATHDLENVLEELQSAAENADGPLTVGDALNAFAHRSFGALLTLAGLVAALPVIGAIPGVSILTGALVILIAAQFLMGRETPWTPGWLRDFSVDAETMRKGAEKAKLASASCDKSKSSCSTKVAAKSSCGDSKTAGATKAVLAKSDSEEPECCKAKLPCCEKAKAEGKKGNCCSGEEKVAQAKLAAAKASCDKSKASCSSTKVAKADAGCNSKGAAKAKLASAECDKEKSCCKSKLASADGASKDCCKAKLASLKTDGAAASCDKSKSSCSSTKVAKADGCCKSKGAAKAKLASAKSCCQGENVIYRVAGRDFKTWDDAMAARDAARSAIKTVAMTYVVDGKKVDCATKVCPTAKAAGKVKFVVGETTTSCELHARVELAKAQIDAARSAMTSEKVAAR